MATRRHELKYSKDLVRELDYLMPKLKYSVYIKKVARWLENFDEKDVDTAIEILSVLEYIDYNELNSRMDEQFRNVVSKIPNDHFIIVYPSVATYPKSTELINYILKDNPTYKKLKSKKRIIITRDIDKDVDFKNKTAFILTDDFIGSGLSFQKGYHTKTTLKEILDREKITQRYLISAICMNSGKDFINMNYPEIEISSTFRGKLFDPMDSVFKLSGRLSFMKKFAYEYGINIYTDGFPPYGKNPFGYEKSESFVAFSHTTPNNTLPIIWSKEKWFPLFPRYADSKISQAKEIKKEVAYFLSIMNRLGLDLYSNQTVVFKDKRTRRLQYNRMEDHSLVTVIKLQMDGYTEPIICQILGLTLKEYYEILKNGRDKKLIDITGNINGAGIDFFKNLMKNVRSTRFIKKDKADFEMKFVNYLPKSFMGKT